MKKVATLFIFTATLCTAEVPQPNAEEERVIDPFGSSCMPTDIRTVLKVKPDPIGHGVFIVYLKNPASKKTKKYWFSPLKKDRDKLKKGVKICDFGEQER